MPLYLCCLCHSILTRHQSPLIAHIVVFPHEVLTHINVHSQQIMWPATINNEVGAPINDTLSTTISYQTWIDDQSIV